MEACVKGCIIFVHVRFELLCCQKNHLLIRRKWKTNWWKMLKGKWNVEGHIVHQGRWRTLFIQITFCAHGPGVRLLITCHAVVATLDYRHPPSSSCLFSPCLLSISTQELSPTNCGTQHRSVFFWLKVRLNPSMYGTTPIEVVNFSI